MKNTVSQYYTGQVTVGTSAAKVNFVKISNGNQKGILVKAHGSGDAAANTIPVFTWGSLRLG